MYELESEEFLRTAQDERHMQRKTLGSLAYKSTIMCQIFSSILHEVVFTAPVGIISFFLLYLGSKHQKPCHASCSKDISPAA